MRDLSAAEDAEGEEKGKERKKNSWKAPGRWRKEKGRRKRRRWEGGSGRLMGRDVAHRQASCRVGSRRGGFRGGYKGRRGSLSEAGGVKAPTHLLEALVRSPRILQPRRQKEPSRSGECCWPCPGELGAERVKDGAQPASCPPPPPLPPTGKVLASPLLPRGPSCLPPLGTLPRSVSPRLFPFLSRKGKVKGDTKSPREGSST